MVLVVAHPAGAAKVPRVRVEADAVLAGHAEANLEALVALRGVEVEDEEEGTALGDDDLALLASHRHKLVFVRHERELLLERLQSLVEVVELKVPEVLGVRQGPLRACSGRASTCCPRAGSRPTPDGQTRSP